MNQMCDCNLNRCKDEHKVDNFVFYMSDGFNRGMCRHCTYLRCDLPEE